MESSEQHVLLHKRYPLNFGRGIRSHLPLARMRPDTSPEQLQENGYSDGTSRITWVSSKSGPTAALSLGPPSLFGGAASPWWHIIAFRKNRPHSEALAGIRLSVNVETKAGRLLNVGFR
jgi:hypothetical protein